MSIFRRCEHHPEWDRIFSMPSRAPVDLKSDASKAFAAEVTRALALSDNPWPGPLWAHQAFALKELFEQRGLVGMLPVGSGKTLLSGLAFTVMGAKRPCLIVPASMLVDTKKTWALLAPHWRIPPLDSIKLISYERLSTPSSGARLLPNGEVAYPDLIARYNPDMIVGDEAHRLGTTSAAGTRRVGRFLAANPSTIFVALSGTLVRSSIKNAAHLTEAALHERSPLPREWEPLEQAADATDARSASAGKRTEPGVLLDHLNADERRAYDLSESEDDARAVVVGLLGRRILETPGVVGASSDVLQIPARLDPVFPGNPDPAIDAEVLALLKGTDTREPWSLPTGQLLADTKALARHLVTVNLGLYLVQDPAPPEPYRLASSVWAKAVRDTIKYRPNLNLDSEFMVRDAVRRGVLPELAESLEGWEAAQAKYTSDTGLREPPSVPMWFSDETIVAVREWLAEGPGLVWVSWRALGQRLSAELGLDYYGAGKRNAAGQHVTDLKGQSAILSYASCGVGTNGLQEHYARQLWTSAPQEQQLGRLHRPGQLADVVRNDVWLPGRASLTRFWRAADTARNFGGRISGSPQKHETFENYIPREPPTGGARWGQLSGLNMDDVGEDA